MKTPLLIGLPASGKSTVTNALCALFNKQNPQNPPYSVLSTDAAFRQYRALPLNSNDEGIEIMHRFIKHIYTHYPKHAPQIEHLAYQSDDKGKNGLHDSATLRQFGEDLFRSFENIMLQYLYEQGRFIQTFPSLSASALLNAQNRALFSPENGYHLYLLDAPESVILPRLLADYTQHIQTGQIIRGGYEMAVKKAFHKPPITALRAQHRHDRQSRLAIYRSIAQTTLKIKTSDTPHSIAAKILSHLKP